MEHYDQPSDGQERYPSSNAHADRHPDLFLTYEDIVGSTASDHEAHELQNRPFLTASTFESIQKWRYAVSDAHPAEQPPSRLPSKSPILTRGVQVPLSRAAIEFHLVDCARIYRYIQVTASAHGSALSRAASYGDLSVPNSSVSDKSALQMRSVKADPGITYSAFS